MKQWLYRKIFRDEFEALDLVGCQRHLQHLRRALEEAALTSEVSAASHNKKKKTKIKPQTQVDSSFHAFALLYVL